MDKIEGNSIKFIVSSGYLGKVLREIDFDDDRITNAKFDENKVLTLISYRDKSLRLNTENRGGVCEFNQTNIRWDWVKRTVRQIDDQPIVIVMSEKYLKIELGF